MISTRLLIYMGGLAACVAVCAFIWFQGVEHGRNEVLAAQNAAVAEWQKQQEAEYEKALAAERKRAETLLSDLSQLQGDFDALRSEVSHVPVIKPVVPGVPDCTAYNPLSPRFAELFNAGASGGRDSQAPADSGDGEMPRSTE